MLLLNSVHPRKPADRQSQVHGFCPGFGCLRGFPDLMEQNFHVPNEFRYLILRKFFQGLSSLYHETPLLQEITAVFLHFFLSHSLLFPFFASSLP
jgi:hypothetical protein